MRELLLDLSNSLKRLIPTGFQFGSHQTVFGVRRIILSESSVGRVLSSLKITTECIANLIPLPHGLPGGSLCRVDGAGADHLQEQLFNGIIDPQSAKSDTARLAVVQKATPAGVTRDIMLLPV